MHAPRAKFERVYIVSPIKVAIIFLTSLHCLFLFIAFLTSFWIKTQDGHYGPLFRCEKILNVKNSVVLQEKIECYVGGFIYDIIILSIPLTTMLIILSFFIAFVAIVTASLSFTKKSFAMRHRYWLCTILLLLFVDIIDWFILIFIPLSYHHEIYHFQWAYGVHCSATLLISGSLIAAILMYNTDDIQYIEGIDASTANHQ